ncbi:ribosome biogenesis GTP-binding protein YihA/YsxC [Oleiagrimonas citrea]|uniref:Probable GTP-binding protein EngB n=1 Tax=Oleiagrimonas citrea TaxID=1665687 RepID=A0A846ZLP3_9GAMM|nr:ribosome biogenesis GTP-binding protein YihA/YsxC [Oleiagrimonas citrea]NKZ38499.1 YihA family ribosome biogenesis GTP-binding protein [Oleiagrimonas citrea]
MSSNPLQRARFALAAHKVTQLPDDAGAEVAFAGRSNAGKSSALNALTGQRALARTSKTPGRTQQMVVFTLDEHTRLVDLPGYGYAKVPESLRAHWRKEIDAYLNQRESLRGVVLIADIRHELKEFDRQMLHFCSASGLQCHLLLTKADKLSRGQAAAAVERARTLCRREGWPASVQSFSSSAGSGLESARETIMTMLEGAPDAEASA